MESGAAEKPRERPLRTPGRQCEKRGIQWREEGLQTQQSPQGPFCEEKAEELRDPMVGPSPCAVGFSTFAGRKPASTGGTGGIPGLGTVSTGGRRHPQGAGSTPG